MNSAMQRACIVLCSLLSLMMHVACAGEEIDPQSSDVATYSAKCTLAIHIAIRDYMDWFHESIGSDKPFIHHFQDNFGTVECIENTQDIRIHMLPEPEGIRGGGVSYWINQNDLTVTKRVFER